MALNIDWQCQESHAFTNPKLPGIEKQKLNRMIEKHHLTGHIFLATSGSTATNSTDIKWVALKKSAFCLSAQTVNQHLNCSQKDIFLNTLPHFHVGGLAMFARAQLCGAKIVDIYNENYKWNPKEFVGHLQTNKATVSSLVPTQVYDLIQNNLPCPNSVKAIVVGGGFLDKNLYEQSQKLNWPLLPSYGMTECCSQIATALPNFQWRNNYAELSILPHVKLGVSLDGRIQIESESLLTGYITQSKEETTFFDPKENGKIVTSDIGHCIKGKLIVYGRIDDNIKINGENVSLIRLQSILEQVKGHFNYNEDCAIIATPHLRRGHKIEIIFTKSLQNDIIPLIIENFNKLVYPFEKIENTFFVDKIPRTELGKLKRNSLMNLLKHRKEYGSHI